MNDDQLLERWRAGDSEAAERLFARHFDRIFRFFHTKLPAEAADLTQRTFLRALEAKTRIANSDRVLAYLYGIARHLLMDHFRGQARRDWQAISRTSLQDLRRSPSQHLIVDENRRMLLYALEQLPLDLQLLLELYYWEDQPIGIIAEVLEMPKGTVKSRLHRARALLEHRLRVLERPALVIKRPAHPGILTAIDVNKNTINA